MAELLFSEALRAQGTDEPAAIVRAFCEPLPTHDEAEDFGKLFDRFADAKVVLLGEATHGTSQFYRARAAITRRLIEKHGFNIVARRRADRPPREPPYA
jgi:erythromycin esterase-like protein